MLVPDDAKLLYFMEGGFYLHSIYATCYMDSIRNDFAVMLAHHVITLSLIFISYSTGFVELCMIVFFEFRSHL
jgi:ceramide synthetase